PDIARILADRGSNPQWKPWWYGLPVKTRAGATTASSAHWPTSAITCRTKPLAISCADTTSRQRPRIVGARLGRRSSGRTWTCSPADFFTAEVLTWNGLVTCYVLFFIELESRRVWIGRITRHPESCWIQQVARNATLEGEGYLKGCRYVLHDRDKKFCTDFCQ